MVDQYEALRKDVTGSDPLSQNRYGLALFLSRGMADWLLVVAQLVPRPLAFVSNHDSSSAPNVSAAAQTDLTLLLADMVLACQQEIRQ